MFKKIFRKKNNKNKEINPEDIFIDSKDSLRFDIEKGEGSLNQPISRFMSFLPFLILILIFSYFLYNLYLLQVVDYDIYKNKSDNNRYNSKIILANRGEIFDRNGIPLAQNSILEDSTTQRTYIKKEGFSNLLGYISYPKQDNLGNYWRDNYTGIDGIELYYQDLLTGINGRQVIEKDVKSLVEAENLLIKAIPGINLTLTIDSVLQEKLFESLKRVVIDRSFISGAAIIMNINNGELLAITSFPEYDNNLMTNASGTIDNKKINELLQDKRTPFLNRAVSGLFTPGSVVKPFVAYGALNDKIISPEKEIYSSGQLVIKNIYGGPDSVFRDWKAHGYINVVRALAESSDEYFYQVGGGYKDQKGLGINKIDEYAKLFGLSSLTGIDIIGEKTGIIPTPEWKRINFIDGEWNIGNTYHTSIGQYGFQVTPIELLRYISAIGNNGKLLTPHLFLSASSSDKLQDINKINNYNNKKWEIIDLGLNQDALKYVKEGMREVVLENGTVQQLNIEGLNIAAKSGTAEIGMIKGKVNSLMTGYFPYNNPKYSFVVIVENGPVGGVSASAEVIKPVLEYISENMEKYFD